jgi:hypothetical protein
MPKKQKVKKPKAPRKARAIKTTSKGSKDKSVKQNVNVNVTSSGGGGSGGSSIPSAQPYYNPMVNAMKQGQKEGENVQIKNLTELLNKTLAQTSKTPVQPSPEAPKISPLFEGEEVNVDYQVKRKPDLENKTLLERVNTNIVDDIEALVNNDDVNDEAEMTNNNNLVVESNEVSKSDADEQFEQNIVDPANFFAFSDKVIKDKYNKPRIEQVINKTFDDYKIMGQDEPLLFDELNNYHFKIIDNSVVPWASIESRGPKKEYVKGFVKSHYSANPEEIKDINEETMILFGKAPNKNQSNILAEYYTEIEEQKALKEQLKVSKAKGKKSKKQTNIEI